MTRPTAFEKRLKRHVTARSHSLFCAVTPGLESFCHTELNRFPPSLTAMETMPGGVEWTGRLVDIYRANLHLKTANRILMRIGGFKATNFQQLDRSVQRIPWELYLKDDSDIRFSITSQHSRLFHKTAIAEHVAAGIQSRLNPTTDPPGAKQLLFARAVDDQFLISLDSSGDLLYQRGVKVHRAKAPLRETLAAALMQLADFKPEQPLIDPMCGSGTFSLEAAMAVRRIPAGWFRRFAFFDWPAFGAATWNHLKKSLAQQIRPPDRPSIYASDVDAAACRRLNDTLASMEWSDTVAVNHADFFNLVPAGLTDRNGLVLINPPFGRRIADRHISRTLFEEICAKLIADFRGWRAGLVVPHKDWLPLIPFKHRRMAVRHGGLRIFLVAGTIKG